MSSADEPNECVRVVVRARPFSKKEIADDRKCVVECEGGLSVTLKNPASDNDRKGFTFDAVYDENSTQRAVYDETAYPLVESVLKGYNGTIFAYGQTGCGKTHTMQGLASPPELRGIIPNSFDHIFDHIQVASKTEKVVFLVRCSYLEIYNEEIRDLLAPQKALRNGEEPEKLELHENPDQGVYVKDLTMTTVDSVVAIDKVMMTGNKYRTTGATQMNETSSRSHSIFTIVIEMSRKGEDGKDHITRGKLNLVDLAGSERASKTGATGARMKEGIKINLSLTALGNVISSLVENAAGGKQRHIPYRDSKLTRLLQDSLGGNTKTVMVAAIGPADYNYEETLSTLRYANRAKNIKNKPKLNEDPKDALLRQYKDEIERLKALLHQHLTAAGTPPGVIDTILSAVGGAMPVSPPNGSTVSPPLPLAILQQQPPQASNSLSIREEVGGAGRARASSMDSTCSSVSSGREMEKELSVTARVGGSKRQQQPAGTTLDKGPTEVAPIKQTSPPSSSTQAPSIASVTTTSAAAALASSQIPLTIRSESSASSVALRAAELELEKERSGRDDMMKKMLALQELVLGGGGGGKFAGGSRSRSNSAGSATGGVASLGEFDDPELQAARIREEHRRARAAELKRSRETLLAKRLAAASSMGESSGGEWEDEEEEEGGDTRYRLPPKVGSLCSSCKGRVMDGSSSSSSRNSNGMQRLLSNDPVLTTTPQVTLPPSNSAYLKYPTESGRPRAPPKKSITATVKKSTGVGGGFTAADEEVGAEEANVKEAGGITADFGSTISVATTAVAVDKGPATVLPPLSDPIETPARSESKFDEKERDDVDDELEARGRRDLTSDLLNESKEDSGGQTPFSPLPFSPPPHHGERGGPGADSDGKAGEGHPEGFVSVESMKFEMLKLQARMKRRYEKRYSASAEALKAEVAEEREEWGNDRERLSSELREVNKLASLLEAVVGLFLPEREKDKALDRAVWDESRERWLLPRVKPRPGYNVRSKVGAISGIGPQGVGLKMAVRNPKTGAFSNNSSSSAAAAAGGGQDYDSYSEDGGVGEEEEEEGGGVVLAPGEELLVEDLASLRASSFTSLPTLSSAAQGAPKGGFESTTNLIGLPQNPALLPSLMKQAPIGSSISSSSWGKSGAAAVTFPALPTAHAPPMSASQRSVTHHQTTALPPSSALLPDLLPKTGGKAPAYGSNSNKVSSSFSSSSNSNLPQLFTHDKAVDKAMDTFLAGAVPLTTGGGATASSGSKQLQNKNLFPKL